MRPTSRFVRGGPLLPLLVVTLATLGACRLQTKDDAVRLNGRIEAPTVDLAAKVSGRVVEVAVREGDRVTKGQLLVRLDLGDVGLAAERDRSGLASAEARLNDLSQGNRRSEIAGSEAEVADRRAAVELASREKDRQASLLAKKVGTSRDLDRATTDLKRSEAALRMSQDRLALMKEGFRRGQTDQARSDVARARTVLKQSETVVQEAEIRAPADGIVLHRMAEPGLLLNAGQPGLTLAFADRLYVRTFIPETKLGRVRTGLAANVFVDAFPGRAFPAHVTEISSEAEFTPKPVETRSERVNLVFAAKVDLDAGWKEPLVP
ncbi:MAG: efflux RND transporter periplasmic adaptor subunit, partial [Thermoanaerobaculia bacterium]